MAHDGSELSEIPSEYFEKCETESATNISMNVWVTRCLFLTKANELNLLNSSHGFLSHLSLMCLEKNSGGKIVHSRSE